MLIKENLNCKKKNTNVLSAVILYNGTIQKDRYCEKLRNARVDDNIKNWQL